MLSRLFFSILLILISSSTFCQSGTLIIEFVTNDAIYIAADSRGSFFGTDDLNLEPIAYVDSFAKIFLLNKYPIAAAGSAGFSGKQIPQIVADFNKTISKKDNFEDSFNEFKYYVSTHFNADSFPERKRESFFGCGYVKGKPCMMAFSLTRDTLMQSGILASDIRALYAHYSFSPTFSQDQMVKLIENLMHEYAYKNSLTNSVGGPVCIAKVNIDNTALAF